jgi:RNA polymerase-associated protein RTF1
VYSEKEIEDFLRAVDNAKGRKPLKAEVLEKVEAISKVNQFVYSASTVKQMLQEKKMAASRPTNIALEKARLIKQLGIAEEKGDHAEVEKLQLRLKELELYANQVKSKDAKAMALAEMNRRNRYCLIPARIFSGYLIDLVLGP